MKTEAIFRISRMLLLATAVSLVVLLMVYALQNPEVMVNLATIGWNGYMST